MKYYKKDNKVYEYSDLQVKQGLAKDKIAMTQEEIELHLNPPKTQEQLDAEAKAEIELQLANLTVEVNGNVFDADKEARQNMADAILASSTLGATETVWRLADNTEQTVTLDELKQAHATAISEYARIKQIGV
jgi:hypothetical protein